MKTQLKKTVNKSYIEEENILQNVLCRYKAFALTQTEESWKGEGKGNTKW